MTQENNPLPQSTNLNGNASGEAEISLIEIVNFVQESWKKLAIAAIVGAVLGLSAWFFLGSYQAEYVLLNNNNNNNNNNSYALDLVSWKTIQKSLPNLAAQIEDEDKAPENHAQLYRALAANLILWVTTEVAATISFSALIFWLSWASGLNVLAKKLVNSD